MTTIEQIVKGERGDSRVMFTPEWKSAKQLDMKNSFSLFGIDFSNLRSNEELIIRSLSEITADGWELCQITPLTQVLNDTGGEMRQSIAMTRYLFRKAK